MTDLNKLMMDIVPFRLGARVKVSPSNRYSKEWPDIYIVTGLEWDYRTGPFVNISIAGEDEILQGSTPTDGWHVEDLLPA